MYKLTGGHVTNGKRTFNLEQVFLLVKGKLDLGLLESEVAEIKLLVRYGQSNCLFDRYTKHWRQRDNSERVGERRLAKTETFTIADMVEHQEWLIRFNTKLQAKMKGKHNA